MFAKQNEQNKQGEVMTLKKQIQTFLFATTLIVTMTSCTEEEVNDTVTIIAAAAIIATIDKNTPDYEYDHGHHHHHGHHPGYGSGYGPGYDAGHRPPPPYCSNNYDPRCHDHRRFSLESKSSSADMAFADLEQISKIENTANYYGITINAAEKLVGALDKAQARDFSGIDDIGIARTDLTELYNNKSLSRYSYVNIGASLGMSFEDAKVFVQKVQQNIMSARQALGK